VEDFEKEKELVRYQHEQIINEQKDEIVSKAYSIIDFRSKRDNEEQEHRSQESKGFIAGDLRLEKRRRTILP